MQPFDRMQSIRLVIEWLERPGSEFDFLITQATEVKSGGIATLTMHCDFDNDLP